MADVSSLGLSTNPVYQTWTSPVQWLTRSLVHIPSSTKINRITAIGIVSLAIIALIGMNYNRIMYYMHLFQIRAGVKRFLQEDNFQENFTLLRSNHGLKEKFQELSKELKPYRNHCIMRSIAESFDKHQKLFLQMRKIRKKLLFVPPRITSSGNIIIPDNGNCLYEAAATCLDLMKPSASLPTLRGQTRSPKLGMSHESLPTLRCQTMKLSPSLQDLGMLDDSLPTSRTESPDLEEEALSEHSTAADYQTDSVVLRQEVVEWMRVNVEEDEKLKERIQHSILALLCDIHEQIDEEMKNLSQIEREGIDRTAQKKELREKKEFYLREFDLRQPAKAIEHYLNEQAKDKTWGSSAEVYAIAKMNNCDFSINVVDRSGSEGNEIDTPIPSLTDSSVPPEEEQTLFNDKKQILRLKLIKNKSHFEPLL